MEVCGTVSDELRYSPAVRKSLSLSMPTILWVDRTALTAPQTPVKVGDRYVCRTGPLGPQGIQPGALVPKQGDLKTGTCNYEYSYSIYRVSNYQILVSIKGNPMNLLRWAPSSTLAGLDNLKAGLEDINQPNNLQLFACRAFGGDGVALNGLGKTGTHLGMCLFEFGSTRAETYNFDVLTYR